jgi:hypothetical protein
MLGFVKITLRIAAAALLTALTPACAIAMPGQAKSNPALHSLGAVYGPGVFAMYRGKMYGYETRLIATLPFVCCLFGGMAGWSHAEDGAALAIRAGVVQTHSDRPTVDAPILFTVTSGRAGLIIFKDWNSWGYFERSFTAFVDGDRSKTFTIQKRPRGWRGNFPATLTLERGASLETVIDVCDGTWFADPATRGNPDSPVTLVPSFRIEPTPESTHVWTGHVTGAPIDVYLSRHCRKRLAESMP